MKVLQQGSIYDFIDNSINVNLLNELPIGIYDVVSTIRGLMLQKREISIFEDITKSYGKLPLLREKFKTEISYYDKLGILLLGEKGSGKSLLAKQICNDSNLPIVIVKESFEGSELSDILNNIPNKFILFIDEFEKLFSTNSKEKNNPQDKFLSILDGNDTSKFITLLTANDENKINSYFKNRTKRIKYFIEFEVLNKQDVEEVLIDMNIDKEIQSKIINIHRIVGELNYDVLMEVINEFKRYPNYSLNDILYFLNIEIKESEYNLTVYSDINGKEEPIAIDKIVCNPYLDINIDIYPRSKGDYIVNSKDNTINIDETFDNSKYSIITDNNCVRLTLKEEYSKQGVDFGKLEFILTPYFPNIKLAI
jgi:hypothetical protein